MSAYAAAISIAVIAAGPLPASAASASFASSYAVELDGFGPGSITAKAGSGNPNFLRATAVGDVVALGVWVNLSFKSGRISSMSVTYSGPSNGSIKLTLKGDFSRELNGGFSIGNGASYRHIISVALRDMTTGTDIRTWNMVNEELLCGGLAYPVGLGGCNGTHSDTYPSTFTKTATGAGIVSGHRYNIRVYVAALISGTGIAFGLQAKTTAKQLTGTLAW
jgi:hypothetical protein